jgi:hypothetical protein
MNQIKVLVLSGIYIKSEQHQNISFYNQVKHQ